MFFSQLLRRESRYLRCKSVAVVFEGVIEIFTEGFIITTVGKRQQLKMHDQETELYRNIELGRRE